VLRTSLLWFVLSESGQAKICSRRINSSFLLSQTCPNRLAAPIKTSNMYVRVYLDTLGFPALITLDSKQFISMVILLLNISRSLLIRV